LGCIVAAINRKGDDAVPLVTRMLWALPHREGAGCGLFTQRESAHGRSLQDLLVPEVRSPVCIGYGLSDGHIPGSERSAVWVDELSSVVEGQIFSHSERRLLEALWSNDSRRTQALLGEVDGDYALISVNKGKLVAYRDPVGTVPLYVGEDKNLVALAPEKKALWAIGMRKVVSFPPGHLFEWGAEADSMKLVKKIVPSPVVASVPTETAHRLAYLLRRAVEKRVNDSDKLALAFSGGLDSGVLAKILLEMGKEVRLICVGIEGSVEVGQAEDAASELCLPITVRVFPKDSVEDVIAKVIWHVEDFEPLKVDLGIPFYWVSKEARDLGMDVLMTGQGSDELFGGYFRHLKVFQDQGGKALDEMLLEDVKRSYETDHELISNICSDFQLGHLAPYADMDLIAYALGIPHELKMNYEGQVLRKAILRVVAKDLGLTESVYMRPKKAMQYGTGVDKVLHGLAKREGLNVRNYLEKRFTEVFPETTKLNGNS